MLCNEEGTLKIIRSNWDSMLTYINTPVLLQESLYDLFICVKAGCSKSIDVGEHHHRRWNTQRYCFIICLPCASNKWHKGDENFITFLKYFTGCSLIHVLIWSLIWPQSCNERRCLPTRLRYFKKWWLTLFVPVFFIFISMMSLWKALLN